MSMIFFACVVRVRDGLPLSASTDFHFNRDFLECRKRLKALSSVLARYPSRGTAKGRDLSIHFLSSDDIACMAICSSNYSTIMAFCFLEELQWEFAASYDTTSINLASRPYAFLEFDNVIQKVKCHFNHASGSQTKANWERIQEELKFQPPVQLKLEDAELMNGMTNGGHAEVHVEVAPTYRMQRVTPLGILSLVLNIMCGALNLIRGVHLAEYSFQEDHEGLGNVIAFFLPFIACVLQLCEEDKDICPFLLCLFVQHLLVRTAQPLANSLSRGSGVAFLASDTDTAAYGETARLRRMKRSWARHALSTAVLFVLNWLKIIWKSLKGLWQWLWRVGCVEVIWNKSGPFSNIKSTSRNVAESTWHVVTMHGRFGQVLSTNGGSHCHKQALTS
ncbi:vesicle-trafficking protein SEC22c isoform X1 [Nothoprocta perdicaria]|uniref:vesicle-trafficking protein SEC22c isoform X1 n=1 Tax=Nothoprocta perdicaria TaxID=30464 RepID=UPI000E1BA9BD|nr:vesicle-trafficking protein SEC22c isoform X1 [Nothoprocta perdicaria]